MPAMQTCFASYGGTKCRSEREVLGGEWSMIDIQITRLPRRVDPFGIYRIQAEVFGGRSDGKFGVR